MSEKIQLRIIAPDGERFAAPVDSVRMRSSSGGFGVKAGHEPMLSSIIAGMVIYDDESGRHSIRTYGGVAEIRKNCVTILE